MFPFKFPVLSLVFVSLMIAQSISAHDDGQNSALIYAKKLQYVERTLSRLDEYFKQKIERVFHDKQQTALESIKEYGNHAGYYALMSVSANVARSEAIQYSIRRKALSVYRNLIEDYFVDKSAKLHKMFLADNIDLFNIIGHRMMLRTYADELYQVESIMKRIYLLLKHYCSNLDNCQVCNNEPEVRELAIYYFNEIDSTRERINLETSQLEVSLERYSKEAAAQQLSSDQIETTVTAIDSLIDERMGCEDCLEENEHREELDGLYSMFSETGNDVEELVAQTIDWKLLEEIKASQERANKELGETATDDSLASQVTLSEIAGLRANLRAVPKQADLAASSDGSADADDDADE